MNYLSLRVKGSSHEVLLRVVDVHMPTKLAGSIVDERAGVIMNGYIVDLSDVALVQRCVMGENGFLTAVGEPHRPKGLPSPLNENLTIFDQLDQVELVK